MTVLMVSLGTSFLMLAVTLQDVARSGVNALQALLSRGIVGREGCGIQRNRNALKSGM